MDTRDTLIKLGVSLGLGLLVGLQRERKGEELAGIRTFALITLFGTISALVGAQMGPSGTWLLAAGTLAIAILMAVGGYLKSRTNQLDIGLTTEVTALVMYGLGAYLAQGEILIAIVLAGAVVLLLHLKTRLHGFVKGMNDADLSAIMQFVLIALVIWPILPNQTFGPYGFFNPFTTWLVVVLVVGMSLAGYVLYKLVRPDVGALLGGAIGGLISSTATTVSYSRRAREDPALTLLSVQAIMMATTVSVLRVMVLVLLFAKEGSPAFLGPLSTLAGTMAMLSLLTVWFARREPASLPEHQNPTELKSALIFAAIFSAVTLATAWAKDTYGASALYVVGGISGLTDVDAITLSMAGSAHAKSVPADIAWRVITVAILANLVFKAGIVYTIGNARLKKWITLLFGGAFLAAVAIMALWRA